MFSKLALTINLLYQDLLGAKVALADAFYHRAKSVEEGPAFGIRSTFPNLLTKFN